VVRHFLDLAAMDGKTLRHIIDESARLKSIRRTPARSSR
jgi:hypothetical protein